VDQHLARYGDRLAVLLVGTGDTPFPAASTGEPDMPGKAETSTRNVGSPSIAYATAMS
jgi:hypothetical protein